MSTLKVGIASYEEMKARTMAVARGRLRITRNEPKVWFTSTESFAKVLSAGNRELLRVIAEREPGPPGRWSSSTPTARGVFPVEGFSPHPAVVHLSGVEANYSFSSARVVPRARR